MKSMISHSLKLVLYLVLVPFLAEASDLTSQKSTLYPFHNIIEEQDDFITGATSTGTIGALGWFVVGGTNSSIAGESDAPGIFRKDTSAVINTVGALLLSGAQTVFDNSMIGNFLIRLRLNQVDVDTTARIGLSNGCTVAITNGAYFERLGTDTNWFAVTNNAGVSTRTDTGVAANTSFQYFSVLKRSASYIFLINNATVATNTTNLPATDLNYCTQIINGAAASKTMDHDYFQFQVFLSR